MKTVWLPRLGTILWYCGFSNIDVLTRPGLAEEIVKILDKRAPGMLSQDQYLLMTRFNQLGRIDSPDPEPSDALLPVFDRLALRFSIPADSLRRLFNSLVATIGNDTELRRILLGHGFTNMVTTPRGQVKLPWNQVTIEAVPN